MQLTQPTSLKLRWTLKVSTFLAASVLVSACAPKSHNTDPAYADPNAAADATANETGAGDIEQQYGALAPSDLKIGLQVFVVSDRLRVRSTPEVKPDNIVGTLDLNDKVEITDPKRIGTEEYVAIRVIESTSDIPKNVTLYTSVKHLDASPRKQEGPSALASKIFVVTNIATEKVRVYLKCEPGEGCVNKLLLEQDVVNGEDEGHTRTDVGVYRVTQWEKFYETPGTYPAWYKAGYPAVPSPGSSLNSWFSKEFMPGGQGAMRGAFGWYTVKVGPNPNGQWMHGTAGWGQDKQRFIKFKNTFWGKVTNLFTSIRSHGCTRIDNESIAYLRTILPVGATYVKIYAKEGTRSAKPVTVLPSKAQWNYIMTKNGGGIINNHELADRDVVLNNGTPRAQWIEEGTLTVDQFPNAVPFDRSKSNSEGGDLYGLGSNRFSGVFLVDEGTTVDYQHPAGLGEGGFHDGAVPSFMKSNDRSYFQPEAERSFNNGYNNPDSPFFNPHG